MNVTSVPKAESKASRQFSHCPLFGCPRNGKVSEHFVQQTWTKWTEVSAWTSVFGRLLVGFFMFYLHYAAFFSSWFQLPCCFFLIHLRHRVCGHNSALVGGAGIKNPFDMEGRSCSVVLYSRCCQACTHLKSVGSWTWLPDTSSWCGLA